MNNKKIIKTTENPVRYYSFIKKRLKSLPKNKEYKLLDIGAGEKILEKLLPENIKYSSLDFEGNYDYLADLDKGTIPIKDKTFDIIVCTETLEHVLYPHKIMEEILRIAKPNALFILSMPNELNLYIRLQYLFNIKTQVQTPFKTITNHLHIHTPRAKDVYNFFSEYIKIKEVFYCWYSRSYYTNNGLKRGIISFFDSLFNLLSNFNPNLFSRNVLVIGIRK